MRDDSELTFEFLGKKCHFEYMEGEGDGIFMPPLSIVDEEGNVLRSDVHISHHDVGVGFGNTAKIEKLELNCVKVNTDALVSCVLGKDQNKKGFLKGDHTLIATGPPKITK